MAASQFDLYFGDIKIGIINDVEGDFLDYYGTLIPEATFENIIEYDGFLDQVVLELSEDEEFLENNPQKLIETIDELLDMGVMPTIRSENQNSAVILEIVDDRVRWRFVEDSTVGRIKDGLDVIWSFISDLAELGELNRVKASEVLDELNRMMSLIENLDGKEEITSKDKQIVHQQLNLSFKGLEKKIDTWERDEDISGEIFDELLDKFDMVQQRISSLTQ